MRYYVALLFLLNMIPLSRLSAQTPNRIWTSYYGYFTTYPNVLYSTDGTEINSSVYDPKSGYVYIVGTTSDSSGIATPGSFKDHFIASFYATTPFDVVSRDIFLAKFDSSGHRIWATYYGGAGNEIYGGAGNEVNPQITVDTNGNIYLAGMTSSDSGIATAGSFNPVFPVPNANMSWGTGVPFLVKFDSSGQRLWATYYGGDYNSLAGYNDTYNRPIALTCDRKNNSIYLAGVTSNPSGIATPGAFKEQLNTINWDIFLVKFNSSGQRLWATYYGGDGTESVPSLYSDKRGDVYLTGQTSSQTGIATQGAVLDSFPDSAYVASFLVKFNGEGQRQWGTYIGGNGLTLGYSVTGNNSDSENAAIYVSGLTSSTSGIATVNAYQSSFMSNGMSNNYNPFLIKYTASGKKDWGTYYGGGSDFYGSPIQGMTNVVLPVPAKCLSVDASNNVLMVGYTNSNSIQGIEKGCYPYPATHHVGFITYWQPDGNLLWGSYYDAPLYSASAANGSNFYVTGNAPFDSLATVGVAQTGKGPWFSGIIARFSSNQGCPDLTITISRQNDQLTVDSNFSSYQWFKNGLAVSGANNWEYFVTDSGFYYVVITDSCGCTYTSDTATNPTAIHNPGKGAWAISLYPNPNKGKFIISGYWGNTNAVVQYLITDLLGRIIKISSFKTHNRYFSKALECSYLNDGIYLIKLTCGDKTEILKFVKKEQ